MHHLEEMLRSRIAASLKRSSFTNCSQWAETYRVMGNPFPGAWSFLHHPWLREMHDCRNPYIVGQKAAQMGYSETMLNRTFYELDILGQNVLYVLPNQTPDATDFSAARFDPALALSQYLQDMFHDVKNVGHKRAGSRNLFIRGSRSRAGMKSLPVAVIVFDEYDEMDLAQVRLAEERVSGQIDKSNIKISTPRIPKKGINKDFLRSTQDHFFFSCPSCSRFIELKFPESVNFDDPKNPHYICYECKATLHHEDKINFLKNAKWISGNTTSDVRGFYINQLYSCTITPAEFARKYYESLQDKVSEQEFHNSNLGIPFISEGSRVTDSDIDECISQRKMSEPIRRNGFICLGGDIGAKIHYEVCLYVPCPQQGDINTNYRPMLLECGKVDHFEQLDLIIKRLNVNHFVIDAQPERRKAQELVNRFHGFGHMCFYGQGISGKAVNENLIEGTCTVDRTSWMDLSLGRFMESKAHKLDPTNRIFPNNRIDLPYNIPMEYRDHIQAPVRLYERDQYGNPVAVYREGGDEDHYAHARTYCEIALYFAVHGGPVTNIISPV